VAPPPFTDVTRIGLGGGFSCALARGGAVLCQGANRLGQLGDGSHTNRSSAARVLDLPPATDIAVGHSHACALLEDHTVRCWGSNERGQIGTGHRDRSPHPTPERVEGVRDVQQIAAGAAHTCALLSSGGVVCWGANARGQLGDGSITDRPLPMPVRW
jgi:alpha-tubulin suppressor-like RCC1 family protein